MLSKRKININKETLLFIVGSLLLIISFILFHYEKILDVSNEIKEEIESKKYIEKTKKDNISINIDVDYIEGELEKERNDNNYVPNYIGFLEIDKINLKQGFLPIKSRYNNVDYHIQIHELSTMPDVIGGNLILASHSGNSSIAYFKNLYKLKIDDIAKIYYNGKIYKYKITNIYNEVKDGSVNIYRDNSKTTLTLITCTKNDKEHQTIYILELFGVDEY